MRGRAVCRPGSGVNELNVSFLTDAELVEMREAWMGAFRAVSTGVKNYMLGTRMLTRYDIDDITDMLAALDEEQKRRTGSRRLRAGRFVPRDG